jgi:hypothetical protein
MLDRYDKNRAYVLDESTIKIIGEIERITKLPSPYSEIHRLPELTADFATHFSAILDEECVPVEAAVREDWETVKREYTAKELADEFGEKVRTAFEGLLDRLSRAGNIDEAIAKQTESDRLKTRLIGEIANASQKRGAANSKDEQTDLATITPSRTIKTVSVKTLFSGTMKASNVEEIDALMRTVRNKLVAQLDENTTIQIV